MLQRWGLRYGINNDTLWEENVFSDHWQYLLSPLSLSIPNVILYGTEVPNPRVSQQDTHHVCNRNR